MLLVTFAFGLDLFRRDRVIVTVPSRDEIWVAGVVSKRMLRAVERHPQAVALYLYGLL